MCISRRCFNCINVCMPSECINVCMPNECEYALLCLLIMNWAIESYSVIVPVWVEASTW